MTDEELSRTENSQRDFPGSSFFPGWREDWPHTQQCIRISLTATDEEPTTGIQRLASICSIHQIEAYMIESLNRASARVRKYTYPFLR